MAVDCPALFPGNSTIFQKLDEVPVKGGGQVCWVGAPVKNVKGGPDGAVSTGKMYPHLAQNQRAVNAASEAVAALG